MALNEEEVKDEALEEASNSKKTNKVKKTNKNANKKPEERSRIL